MNIEDIVNYQDTITEKLKNNPKGFKLDDDYICVVCQKIIRDKNGWYDHLGPKCFLCQKALNNNVIPAEVCRKRKKWLAMWEVSQLGIHPMVIKKLIKRRKLKARIIKNLNNEPYFYVFIKKENPLLKQDP